MLENEMKISLTLVAFDKMSKVLRDAVHKSNEEFTKLQNKIQQKQAFGTSPSCPKDAVAPPAFNVNY